jgi:hypothetical protein
MIVIVETNFILELVIQQAEAEPCRRIASLSHPGGPITLAISAFSVAEAMMTIERKRGERKKFVEDDLKRFIREIRRSEPRQHLAELLTGIEIELVKAEDDEASRLAWFLGQVIPAMDVIPLTSDMLLAAYDFKFERTSKYAPDAIILASTIQYLQRQRANGAGDPFCFVSRDRRGFSADAVSQQLKELGCRILSSFEDAAKFIQAGA